MNKDEFFDKDKNKDVCAFVEWIVGHGSTLEIGLNIKQSRFVSRPIVTTVSGLESVLAHYMWKSNASTTGAWPATFANLHALSESLKNKISNSNDAGCMADCKAILTWGGNRNWEVGAWPHLCELPSVTRYLATCQSALSLEKANIDNLPAGIGRMNSMLTKVHALASKDGLPIYDSRVAAAIATLVELWRRADGKEDEPLPAALTFPAISGTRTVGVAFPDAVSAGMVGYGAPNMTADWCSAKIRLGWLLEKILGKTDWFDHPGYFGDSRKPVMSDRMHAFEAVLFMIGYDVRCLVCSPLGTSAAKPKGKRKSKSSPVQKAGNSVAHKSVSTLSGKGKTIHYSGTMSTGFEVEWGDDRFLLDPEFLADLIDEFDDTKDVRLGASRDSSPAGSLGSWVDSGTTLTPQHASAIAAILVAEGHAQATRRKGIFLDFRREAGVSATIDPMHNT